MDLSFYLILAGIVLFAIGVVLRQSRSMAPTPTEEVVNEDGEVTEAKPKRFSKSRIPTMVSGLGLLLIFAGGLILAFNMGLDWFQETGGDAGVDLTREEIAVGTGIMLVAGFLLNVVKNKTAKRSNLEFVVWTMLAWVSMVAATYLV